MNQMLFLIGIVYATPSIYEMLSSKDICTILNRHALGDFGEVPYEDANLNIEALTIGGRIFSSYTVNRHKVWIITEADRSITTIMLPDEY